MRRLHGGVPSSSFSGTSSYILIIVLATSGYMLLDWSLPLNTQVVSSGCEESEIEMARKTRELEWEITQCLEENSSLTVDIEKAKRELFDTAFKVPGFRTCDLRKQDDILYYFKFVPKGVCPNDWILAQQLMLDHDCLVLKRRQCHSPGPPYFVDPLPHPECLWSLPDNRNIDWGHYSCGSYSCLQNRKYGDCRECYNLTGSERTLWDQGADRQPTIADVFALKKGSIRIGLDLGGGTGSFAAVVRERYNATIVTTGMNTGSPLLETAALRGLPTLQLSHYARLPFFDGTLDLIHSRHSVHILTPEEFELALFDWDRVLRPGGLIWLEGFYQPVGTFNDYLPVVDKLNYKRHYYVIFSRSNNVRKLTAVLEKLNPRPRRIASEPPVESDRLFDLTVEISKISP